MIPQKEISEKTCGKIILYKISSYFLPESSFILFCYFREIIIFNHQRG